MKSFKTVNGVICTLLLCCSQLVMADWANVPNDITISTSRPSIDRATREYVVHVNIANSGDLAIVGPFRILVENANIPVTGEDGISVNGAPFFTFTAQEIASGSSINSTVRFEVARRALNFNTRLQHLDPNVATYAEAEGGGAGLVTSFGTGYDLVEGDPTYVTPNVNVTSAPEGAADEYRIIQQQITFPAPGTYELYVRLLVGPSGATDDSFFAPTAFGDNNSWVSVNNISGFPAPGEDGYTPGEPVVGGGSGATEVWKWLRMTSPVYVVPEDELTQVFRFAGREDGLFIDKFAFSNEGVLYTIDELENGQAGAVVPPPEPIVPEGPPMAEGKDKFVGGVCCGRQRPNFEAYWNQVTPENAGKWGSVEGTRDVMNWTELDQAYNLAKDNGYIYKHHVLVWGNQQPGWLPALADNPAEQLQEITEWFNLLNARYPAMDFIEVVNEFENDPPNAANGGPNYINALRLIRPETTTELIVEFMDPDGLGLDEEAAIALAANIDWIINTFQLARDIFPPSTKLMINEYSVINTDARTTRMIQIINLLQDRGLIDAIGFQGHAFSTGGNTQNMIDNMDRLYDQTGLDLYVTELDIDGPTDTVQLLGYQRLFPAFWNHPGVKGITTWGYLPGHWRENQGAHLAFENGAEKPALVWLKGYVRGVLPQIVAPEEVEISSLSAIGSLVVDLDTVDANGSAHPDDTEITWSVLGGSGAEEFALDPLTGAVTLATGIDPQIGSYILQVQVQAGYYISTAYNLEIIVLNDGELTATVIVYDFIDGLEGWRNDYGTNSAVVHNAAEQAAEVTPDISVTSQNLIEEISSTDMTGSTIEYVIRVTEDMVARGVTAQGYVQTGAPGYARIYGPVVALQAGVNTFTFSPNDDGSGNLQIIERFALQLNGTFVAGETVLIDQVTVTIPVTTVEGPVLEYDFVTDTMGWRGDYGTNATVIHNAAAEAAEIVPDWSEGNQFLIEEISSTDLSGTTIEYTVNITPAQAAGGLTAQGAVQTGAPNYTRIYGPVETLVAGPNTFSFTPSDDGSGSILVIERLALQLNGPPTDGIADNILLENMKVFFP